MRRITYIEEPVAIIIVVPPIVKVDRLRWVFSAETNETKCSKSIIKIIDGNVCRRVCIRTAREITKMIRKSASSVMREIPRPAAYADVHKEKRESLHPRVA